jgi:hypothetical protein
MACREAERLSMHFDEIGKESPTSIEQHFL